MTAGDAGGAQVKSAVRTVGLLEYFAGRPGLHSLAAVQKILGHPEPSLRTRRARGTASGRGSGGSRSTARTTRWGCAASAWPCRTAPRPRDAVSCSVPVARLTPAHERTAEDALSGARDRLALATRGL